MPLNVPHGLTALKPFLRPIMVSSLFIGKPRRCYLFMMLTLGDYGKTGGVGWVGWALAAPGCIWERGRRALRSPWGIEGAPRGYQIPCDPARWS